ncbi:phage head-tail joining protein [Rhodopseudomonas palustris]
MALTAAQIEERIAQIRAARDSGVLIVRHGDAQSTFRSLAEMNAIIADLQSQLAAVTGAKRPRVNYLRQGSRGY